jgi:hypothetical protein
MTRIGIGITSTPSRPAHLELCLSQMNKYMPEDAMLFVAHDTNKMGVAYQKNKCLEALKECDYVFLFDDDCFPIEDGWADAYISEYIRTGNHHFLKINETPSIEIKEVIDGITSWTNCAGCMMFLTRSAIQTVGMFDESFGRYGYEHAEYTNRIYQNKFNLFGQYLSCTGNDKIYAIDLQGVGSFNIKHKSSMPFKEMLESVKKAEVVYRGFNLKP